MFLSQSPDFTFFSEFGKNAAQSTFLLGMWDIKSVVNKGYITQIGDL